MRKRKWSVVLAMLCTFVKPTASKIWLIAFLYSIQKGNKQRKKKPPTHTTERRLAVLLHKVMNLVHSIDFLSQRWQADDNCLLLAFKVPWILQQSPNLLVIWGNKQILVLRSTIRTIIEKKSVFQVYPEIQQLLGGVGSVQCTSLMRAYQLVGKKDQRHEVDVISPCHSMFLTVIVMR